MIETPAWRGSVKPIISVSVAVVCFRQVPVHRYKWRANNKQSPAKDIERRRQRKETRFNQEHQFPSFLSPPQLEPRPCVCKRLLDSEGEKGTQGFSTAQLRGVRKSFTWCTVSLSSPSVCNDQMEVKVPFILQHNLFGWSPLSEMRSTARGLWICTTLIIAQDCTRCQGGVETTFSLSQSSMWQLGGLRASESANESEER